MRVSDEREPRPGRLRATPKLGKEAMEVRILGPLELAAGDRLVALGGAKQRALLAVLTLRARSRSSRASG